MRLTWLALLVLLVGCGTSRKESKMPMGCSHVVLGASDLKASRHFYVDLLGMEILQESDGMLAFRAGEVRVSVFGGGRRLDPDKDGPPNLKPVFSTERLDDVVKILKGKGVEFLGEIEDAPGFMRFIPLRDPDNNVLFLGEYAADPLKKTKAQ